MPSGNVINHTLTTNPINGVQSWVPNDLLGPKWERDGKDRSGMVRASVALKPATYTPRLRPQPVNIQSHDEVVEHSVVHWLSALGVILVAAVIVLFVSIILVTAMG